MFRSWLKISRFFHTRTSQDSLAWLLFAFVVVISSALIFKTFSAAADTACDSGNTLGWGWNPYFGWISLSSANFTDIEPVCYGVKVAAAPIGDGTYPITGFAWNGWGTEAGEGYYICFGASCAIGSLTYTNPPGTPSGTVPSASFNPSTNQISGWARFVGWNDDAGAWIKLDDSSSSLLFGAKIYQKSDNSAVGFISPSVFTLGAAPTDPSSDPVSYDPLKNYSWNSGLGWIQWRPATGCYCSGWADGACDYGASPPSTACVNKTRECSQPDPSSCLISSCFPPPANESLCADSKDNDCDTCIDKVDSNCGGKETAPSGGVPNLAKCSDTQDNDCDGLIDCADSDCSSAPACRIPGTPSFEISNTICGQTDLSITADPSAPVPTATYNIYRSLSEDGCNCPRASSPFGCSVSASCARITTSPISSPEPTAYVDTEIIPRASYYYWVSAVSDGGTESVASGPLTGRTNCFPGHESHE